MLETKLPDLKFVKKGKVRTATNHDGGVNGGISNGENIFFRVAFKPIPSIQMEQRTINRSLKPETIRIKGQHDICAVPRAVPLVEALTYFVLADHYLMQKSK